MKYITRDFKVKNRMYRNIDGAWNTLSADNKADFDEFQELIPKVVVRVYEYAYVCIYVAHLHTPTFTLTLTLTLAFNFPGPTPSRHRMQRNGLWSSRIPT